MSAGSDPRTTVSENDSENKDPFVVTPPRKSTHQTQTTTPSTPKSQSKNTPLHKRFLEEVTMSPGAPSTPPRTPSRSPLRGTSGKEGKQTLEVGQNGFYFSMEIPEKKNTPRKMGRMTPDVKAEGRRTPSPEKEKRSEVKGAGRVKDILRKNLFGTPTKKAIKLGRDHQEQQEVERKGSDVKMKLLKDDRNQVEPSCTPRISDSSGCESGQHSELKESAAEHAVAPSMGPDSPIPSAPLQTTMPPSTTQKSNMSPAHQQTPNLLSPAPAPITNTSTPSALASQEGDAVLTPSNIGHLMASLSNKNSKVQTLPTVGGTESMPTPLRKMSERLGLRSPHVVRRGQYSEDGRSSPAAMTKRDMLREQISVLDLRDAATTSKLSLTSVRSDTDNATIALTASEEGRAMRRKDALSQLLGSPLIIPSTTFSQSRPSTATSSKFASPSTPSRPGAPSRSQSFGTPTRLRSSMQEDMYKMQESLKRSLGPEAFEKRASGRVTPVSPTVTATSTVASGSANLKGESSVQAVPRRPLNNTARRPRPKSVIVGSAKVLEAVASQIDSPRERAKLRSAAATPSNTQTKPTASRPGTAASASRAPGLATRAMQPASKPQPTIRTMKSAALRVAAHPIRAAPSAPTTTSGPGKQRVASSEAIAGRVAEWKREERKDTAPKIPVRSKSVKAPSKAPSKTVAMRKVKTPEPKDPKSDSGTAQSYTPPGNPTRLPFPIKSPSKTRLVVLATPAPKQKERVGPPPSTAPKPLPAKTPVNRRIASFGERDPNALRTPSKEIQTSLDEAIDRKIREDRRRWEGVLGQLE